jgi:hypothetical protein
VDAVTTDVGELGVQAVRSELHPLLKHPTGRYESMLEAVTEGQETVVSDQGSVYGPWLAGVDSRNRASRFKGYAHWRRARQRLGRAVERVTDAAGAKLARDLGGG